MFWRICFQQQRNPNFSTLLPILNEACIFLLFKTFCLKQIKKCMFFITLSHWHWFTRDRLVQMIDKLYMVLALTATSIEDRASRWELWLLRNAHAYWCVSTENKDEEFTGLGIQFTLSLFALSLKIAHITVKSDCEQFALVFLNLGLKFFIDFL